jgi:exosortase
MASRWGSDPQYSHGYLVPLFSLALLWLRRARLDQVEFRVNWWGLPLLLLGVAGRILGAYMYFDWLDAASLVPCLAGLCVLFGGWRALSWAWPSIVFLLFMIPMPFRIETALSHPLRRIATHCSAYLMLTLGMPALTEGNTILLNSGRIGIVGACSGLSMLLIFFALSTAVAIVIDRPLLDKVVVVLSAIPVAVIVNVLRITITGVAQELFGPELAHKVFHDWAGFLMMPMALGLLWLLLWVLSHLLIKPERTPHLAPGKMPGVGPTSGKSGKHHKSLGVPLPFPSGRA